MNLVRWPFPSGEWHDTGEGGMFAYAVWEADDSWDHCNVERSTDLTQFDCPVYCTGPLTQVFLKNPTSWKSVNDARVQWEAEYPEGPSFYVSGTFDRLMRYECDFGAVIYLGSTPNSLFSEVRGEYFGVVKDLLTPNGYAVVDHLEKAYDKEATLLTLLDT